MADRKKQSTAAFILIVTALYISACTPSEKIEPQKLCPGKSTPSQAISALKANWQNAPTFKANGKCRWEGYDDEQNKRKENFPIRIWVAPPDRFSLHGDVFFNSSGIVLGSNADNFWLVTRPKEIRGYYWGDRTTSQTAASLFLGPQNIFEALGAITIDNDNTELANNILTEFNPDGSPAKKIHIDTCTDLVKKIEYFDNLGILLSEVELNDYEQITEHFSLPMRINITRSTDTFEITLNSAKPRTIKPKLQNRLFNRPDPAGFEKIFKLDPTTDLFIEDKF